MTKEPSRRQWQIERLLAEGLPRAEIAARLGISLATVKHQLYSHRQQGGSRYVGLYERIGARNQVQAALWWHLGGKDYAPAGLEAP